MQLLYPMHTAILVSNLVAAQHFYGTVLGLAEVDRSTSLNFSGCWYQLGNYQIHLIVDESQCHDGPQALANLEKWGRNNHLAIAIADLESARAHLHAHNWPMQNSASGRSALFIQDPDGNVIELQAVTSPQ